MTDNEMKIRHVSQCPTADWCRGYNEAVEKANEIINRQKAEIEELCYKLECLLCTVTGSKLSKSTYTLNTMETHANDYIQKCCEEAQAEAVKEFSVRLKEESILTDKFGEVVLVADINNCLKKRGDDADG